VRQALGEHRHRKLHDRNHALRFTAYGAGRSRNQSQYQ
jgi:hypothetical protein